MSGDLPVRGVRVRRRGPRRASAAFSPRRALAALVLLAAAGATWGMVASPLFHVRAVEVEGAAITGDAAVLEALALGSPGPNTFVLVTDDLRERLLALPAVEDASVSVGLPGTVRAAITERTPVLVWRRGDAELLVDRDGRVIADARDGTAAAGAAEGLPRVVDRREAGPLPATGDRIDATEVDVATRLLSLVPADVGSTAPALVVGVSDEDGWTLVPAVDEPWEAVFGFYGRELRTPDMIPEQVRLLRSLLEGREARLARVILAGERNGTFVLKPKDGG